MLPLRFWFLPVPILVLVTMYGLIRAVARNAHYTPFLLTLVLIFLGYSGLAISVWPNILPGISIWQAAAACRMRDVPASRLVVQPERRPSMQERVNRAGATVQTRDTPDCTPAVTTASPAWTRRAATGKGASSGHAPCQPSPIPGCAGPRGPAGQTAGGHG